MIYKNSSYCVWTEDRYSSWFKVITGMWQGCIISTLLFAAAIDWVLHHAPEDQSMTWLQVSHFSYLDFPDDIAALADNGQDLQDLTDLIIEHAGALSLSIYTKKTKNMLTGTISLPLISSLSNIKSRMFKNSHPLAVLSTSRGIWTANYVVGLVKHQWPLASWGESGKQEILPKTYIFTNPASSQHYFSNANLGIWRLGKRSNLLPWNQNVFVGSS